MPKYINVDFELFFIKELTHFDMLLYSHIRNYTNAKPMIPFDKSQSQIAFDFQVSLLTVNRCIAKLKKYGLIKWIRLKSHKGDSQRLLIKSVELKDSKLYKEKYAYKPNGSISEEDKKEADKVISELMAKWHR